LYLSTKISKKDNENLFVYLIVQNMYCNVVENCNTDVGFCSFLNYPSQNVKPGADQTEIILFV